MNITLTQLIPPSNSMLNEVHYKIISHRKHGDTQLSPPLTREVTLALALRFQFTCQHPKLIQKWTKINVEMVVLLSLVCMHVDGLIKHD